MINKPKHVSNLANSFLFFQCKIQIDKLATMHFACKIFIYTDLIIKIANFAFKRKKMTF